MVGGDFIVDDCSLDVLLSWTVVDWYGVYYRERGFYW